MSKLIVIIIAVSLCSILGYACSMGEPDCDPYSVERNIMTDPGSPVSYPISRESHDLTRNESFKVIPYNAIIEFQSGSGFEFSTNDSFWKGLGFGLYSETITTKTYTFSGWIGPWEWGCILKMHDQYRWSTRGQTVQHKGCFTHNYEAPVKVLSDEVAYHVRDQWDFAYVTGPI